MGELGKHDKTAADQVRFNSGKKEEHNPRAQKDRKGQGGDRGREEQGDGAIFLEIDRRQACFSQAETEFFREVVAEGHGGQTHFIDPSLDY